MSSDHVEKPLRILTIVHLPWDPRLGAARVCIEFSEEWRKAGHTVEKFCLTDAFPKSTSSRATAALRQMRFSTRAAKFVRENAHRFDIIDCLIGTLPFAKESLGFHGLIVARSIGLHRLYERFDLQARERWPDQPKGRLFGPLFHSLRARRLRRNADESIRHCDLLNLPNESELKELERTNFRKPAIILPYGLNEQHRAALSQAAHSTADRLQKKEICFIGMWSLRKGARDWPDIIRKIRAEIPESSFVFLGTMFGEETVRAELGPENSGAIECIPTYDPGKLPTLLADCALGLFPSYVEGFGLAVLEQLAAGIPTIAYDVAGPREILAFRRDIFLTRAGDTAAIAARAVELLRISPNEIATLASECVAEAAKYRWSEIAEETVRHYRGALARLRDVIVFTQPFPLGTAGGGPRILRSLLRDAPVTALAVCTSPGRSGNESETRIPLRPDFGRIERTRFNRLAHSVTPFFQHRFNRRLEKFIVNAKPRALHAVAHGGLDFYSTFILAKKFQIPFFLQVHDDVAYTGAGRVAKETLAQCMSEAWQGAAARFVISPELGAEYTRRYGEREFVTVTDGLDHVALKPRARTQQFRIYFMGLFHIGYEQNLEALNKALDLLPSNLTSNCSITLRCDYVRPSILRQSNRFRVLPFGTEADVQADIEEADCLYLPLHFGKEDQPFGAYSLSTKMVTYLGSGVPILYHGPTGTAAYNILAKSHAAALATSLVPAEITQVLIELPSVSAQFAENALRLARKSFLRAEQHAKFWRNVTPWLRKTETMNAPP
jgi:glycosyltransferase involved in cell wall biosynthesis